MSFSGDRLKSGYPMVETRPALLSANLPRVAWLTEKGRQGGWSYTSTRQSGTLVGAPQKCSLGHILTYYDGSQPQYTHLRASMLAYAHINLLSMLSRFKPDEAVRVTTDSIYVRTSALRRLEGVEAFIPMKICDCRMCVPCLLGEEFPRSPQPNGVIRTRSSTCPWNMQPISPSLII